MARPHALVAAVAAVALVLLASPVASAEPRALPDTRATLDLDARTWTPVDPAPDGVLAAYRGSAGAFLAITKTPIPNPDAWREKTREAYVDEVERGVAAAVPGYKRTKRTIVGPADAPRTDGTGEAPYVDLEARTKDGILVMRVMLYRTYALAIAVKAPRAQLSMARAAVRTLVDAPQR